MTTAMIVTIVEIVPAIARLPVETKAPIRGVSKVVPQVGQPAPSAISPVIMPALSRLAVFCFFFQRRTMRPISIPCSRAIEKVDSQSRNGWLKPNIARKESSKTCRLSGNPRAPINSNLEKPPCNRLINIPKNKKLGIKPYQKRFSLVASKIPFAAIAKSSNHFLQFMIMIIA